MVGKAHGRWLLIGVPIHPLGNAAESVEGAPTVAAPDQELRDIISARLVEMVTCPAYDASHPVIAGMKVSYDYQEIDTRKAIDRELMAHEFGLKTSAIPDDHMERGVKQIGGRSVRDINCPAFL